MTFRFYFGNEVTISINCYQVCDLVERHIWALGKGLDQWQGPPEEEEEQQQEEKEKETKEETEEEEQQERVKLNCQTGASKYTK